MVTNILKQLGNAGICVIGATFMGLLYRFFEFNFFLLYIYSNLLLIALSLVSRSLIATSIAIIEYYGFLQKFKNNEIYMVNNNFLTKNILYNARNNEHIPNYVLKKTHS